MSLLNGMKQNREEMAAEHLSGNILYCNFAKFLLQNFFLHTEKSIKLFWKRNNISTGVPYPGHTASTYTPSSYATNRQYIVANCNKYIFSPFFFISYYRPLYPQYFVHVPFRKKKRKKNRKIKIWFYRFIYAYKYITYITISNIVCMSQMVNWI